MPKVKTETGQVKWSGVEAVGSDVWGWKEKMGKPAVLLSINIGRETAVCEF
jgi:hypothetical protein